MFDQLTHGLHFLGRGEHDELAGAQIPYGPAPRAQGGFDDLNQVRGGGVLELNHFGEERLRSGRIAGGDAGDLGLAVVGDHQAVVDQEGLERVLRRHVLEAEGNDRLGQRFAVGAQTARDLGIEHDVELGLPGEGLDGIREQGVFDDDGRYDFLTLRRGRRRHDLLGSRRQGGGRRGLDRGSVRRGGWRGRLRRGCVGGLSKAGQAPGAETGRNQNG